MWSLPQDAGSSIPYSFLILAIIGLLLVWTVVVLRIYVRTRLIRYFGTDDVFNILASLTFTTLCTLTITIWSVLQVDNGSTDQLSTQSKVTNLFLAAEVLYIATSILVKISFAMFFLRIITERWQRWMVICSMVTYTVYATSYLLLTIFQCGLPQDFFVREVLSTCPVTFAVLRPLGYIQASLNAFTDWLFAIVPIFVLRKSLMPFRTKLTVYGLLSLGSVASIASCMRFAYIDDLEPTADFIGHATRIGTWSVIEPTLAIVATSLAALRPLFHKWFEHHKSSSAPRMANIPNPGKSNRTEDTDWSEKWSGIPDLTINESRLARSRPGILPSIASDEEGCNLNFEAYG